jgi:hypothetical protein
MDNPQLTNLLQMVSGTAQPMSPTAGYQGMTGTAQPLSPTAGFQGVTMGAETDPKQANKMRAFAEMRRRGIEIPWGAAQVLGPGSGNPATAKPSW